MVKKFCLKDKDKEKEYCCKCGEKEKLKYHAYCRDCYNKYMRKYQISIREEDSKIYDCQVLYKIINLKNGLPIYIGSTSQVTVRYRKHFETTNQTSFSRMVHTNNLNKNDYVMYVLDLEKIKITNKERERIALEHYFSYENRETIINTDIEVNMKDVELIEQMGQEKLKLLNEIEWELYEEFLYRKQKNSVSNAANIENTITSSI